MTSYDVIVIGLGGMGSAAASHLARRGLRVLGLDRFGPAHDQGSSHGESRMVRQAYFEDPAYVPLLLRSYQLWDELGASAAAPLLQRVGGLMIGAPTSSTVAGSRRSAEHWALPHRLLSAGEVASQYPTMNPRDDEQACYEDAAGYVSPELAVLAHLAAATAAGADLRHGEAVHSWTAASAGGPVTVHTAAGSYLAASLVVAPGAWAPGLLSELPVPLTVERQVQFWFRPTTDILRFQPPRQPVWIWEAADGRQAYGFPAQPGAAAVKVAFFRGGVTTSPDSVDRRVHPFEAEEMRGFLRDRIPGLDGPLERAVTCLYTNTPDQHFVVGTHPDHDQVAVACGFSGHGFKFVPVIGEVIADLVTTGRTRHPIDLFRPDRFAGHGAQPDPPHVNRTASQ